MRTSTALLIALALLAPSAGLSAQQAPITGANLTGTWVINLAKSDLGPMPAPTIDSSTVTRVGNTYEITTTSDFGGQGTQHRVLKWPVGEGEASNDMSNGATIRTTTKVLGDTKTLLEHDRDSRPDRRTPDRPHIPLAGRQEPHSGDGHSAYGRPQHRANSLSARLRQEVDRYHPSLLLMVARASADLFT